ncbi:hypothetical protein Pen02_63610 [Plantactinospora endophytica]|uniref:DUF427 domain-containing protein n=1 Tax=Plantactinospora endophytica TaxID=673535 RepID=A0ABQ4E9L7_9ACTN|nr:hypothetical protein Pen02_63610 [Plantactinospora endophytica]
MVPPPARWSATATTPYLRTGRSLPDRTFPAVSTDVLEDAVALRRTHYVLPDRPEQTVEAIRSRRAGQLPAGAGGRPFVSTHWEDDLGAPWAYPLAPLRWQPT